MHIRSGVESPSSVAEAAPEGMLERPDEAEAATQGGGWRWSDASIGKGAGPDFRNNAGCAADQRWNWLSLLLASSRLLPNWTSERLGAPRTRRKP